MRSQHKGSSSLIIDKKTDKIKAQQEIGNSLHQERNHDPAEEHVKKLKNGVKNGFGKNKFRKNGKSILLIMMHNLVKILLFKKLINLTYLLEY